MGLAGEAEQRAGCRRIADAVGVEQRAGELLGEADALDEASPRVVDVGGRLVLGQPAHDLGRLHQGVVGPKGLRGVPGVPRTVMVHQKAPFSPVMTGRRTPSGLAMGKPPASVMR